MEGEGLRMVKEVIGLGAGEAVPEVVLRKGELAGRADVRTTVRTLLQGEPRAARPRRHRQLLLDGWIGVTGTRVLRGRIDLMTAPRTGMQELITLNS